MNSHLTLCWSVKGGQGVTVTTALLALAIEHHGIGVDVIDHTGGDLAAALAVPPFDRRANTLQQAINEAVAVTERVRLLSLDADDPRVQLALLAHLEQADQERRHVVIDGGQTTAWARGGTLEHLATIAARSYLVIRPCYLAVRRAVADTPRPTGLIMLSEPGRALRRSDIESALGLPVAAELTVDPAIARAVDAGLLTTRLPAGAAGDLRAWPGSAPDRRGPASRGAGRADGSTTSPAVEAGRCRPSVGGRVRHRSAVVKPLVPRGPSPAG